MSGRAMSTSSTFPTDAEREAVTRAMHDTEDGGPADILDALAPLVADRERAARVEALREAAKEWQWGGWANDLPPGHSRPQLILGMAQRAASWLRAEADRIERGDS